MISKPSFWSWKGAKSDHPSFSINFLHTFHLLWKPGNNWACHEVYHASDFKVDWYKLSTGFTNWKQFSSVNMQKFLNSKPMSQACYLRWFNKIPDSISMWQKRSKQEMSSVVYLEMKYNEILLECIFLLLSNQRCSFVGFLHHLSIISTMQWKQSLIIRVF